MSSSTWKHRLACAAIASALPCSAQSDWTTYGHDAGQTKYSPLDQINTSNVDQLKQAWVYHMKPAEATESANGRRLLNSPATPLVVDGILYVATPVQLGDRSQARNRRTHLDLQAGPVSLPGALRHLLARGPDHACVSSFLAPPTAASISLNAKTGQPTCPVWRERVPQRQSGDDRRSKSRRSLFHDLRGFHL